MLPELLPEKNTTAEVGREREIRTSYTQLITPETSVGTPGGCLLELQQFLLSRIQTPDGDYSSTQYVKNSSELNTFM